MRRRLTQIIVVALIAGLVVVGLATSDTLGGLFDQALSWAKGVIERHPSGGPIVFVLLSALSAMAAFFSSALLVPVATAAWGKLWTSALLWLGWILGGAIAYAIGRFLGRSVVRRLIPGRLEHYQRRVGHHTRWWMMLLFQLGMPSEVPGYLAGMVRYPLLGYLSALAVAELPYAAGAVFLGESFAQRNAPLFLGVAALSVLFLAIIWKLLRAASAPRRRGPSGPAARRAPMGRKTEAGSADTRHAGTR
jgi:uncharacterized membrane protein YdjX (TVP38/TMEM64 family)